VQGHEVHPVRQRRFETSAKLVSMTGRSFLLDPTCADQLAHHILMLERLLSRGNEVDILHFPMEFLHFPTSRRLNLARDHAARTAGSAGAFSSLCDVSGRTCVSISDSQHMPLPLANWGAYQCRSNVRTR
jgi:hypothetical protein